MTLAEWKKWLEEYWNGEWEPQGRTLRQELLDCERDNPALVILWWAIPECLLDSVL